MRDASTAATSSHNNSMQRWSSRVAWATREQRRNTARTAARPSTRTSRATALQNAIETARVAPDATSILVVSSPYHLGRCLVYFQRAFPNSVVDVAAALPDKRNDGSCGRFFEGFYWAKTLASVGPAVRGLD